MSYMTDSSREQCADPYFSIGYAKEALASAIHAMEIDDKEWALVNMRTALGALNENSEARERKFSPPF